MTTRKVSKTAADSSLLLVIG